MSFKMERGETYAILGPNGSGKSTFLKILSGQQSPDSGTISYEHSDAERVYSKLNFTAPYIDIPEEFSFSELLKFHANFKKPIFSAEKMVNKCGLGAFKDKSIKEYSSGMKQRVKLALNLFFEAELRLFDEPCSHLDAQGYSWFHEQKAAIEKDSITCIASNDKNEYLGANQHIELANFK